MNHKLRVYWTDELLTGDAEIDEQHRTFFEKAREIIIACEAGQGAHHVEKLLGYLQAYAESHFKLEEDRMATIQYPYIETHKAAHRSFINRVNDLTSKLVAGGETTEIARAVAEMVTDWFTRHIRLVDKPLIELLAGQRKL